MFGGSLPANRPKPRAGLFASEAGLIESAHRFVRSAERRVEVGAGLLKRRIAEHVLHVVHGPTSLEQARAACVPQVVECRLIAR